MSSMVRFRPAAVAAPLTYTSQIINTTAAASSSAARSGENLIRMPQLSNRVRNHLRVTVSVLRAYETQLRRANADEGADQLRADSTPRIATPSVPLRRITPAGRPSSMRPPVRRRLRYDESARRGPGGGAAAVSRPRRNWFDDDSDERESVVDSEYTVPARASTRASRLRRSGCRHAVYCSSFCSKCHSRRRHFNRWLVKPQYRRM